MNAPSDAILDHPLITERYFFPRPDAPAEITWVDVDGARLACYHHRPFEQGRTVVHFHGNGEVVADYLPWFPKLFESRGLNTFLAEFRGYGASTGTPLYGSMLDDVEPIFRAVDRPEEQMIVFGRSLGSTYALELAARHPNLCGMIIESGIADPLERLRLRFLPGELGESDEMLAQAAARRLNHQVKLSRFNGKLLIIHAADDTILNASNPERLAQWGNPAKTEMVLFEHGDHNGVMSDNFDAYWAAVDRFL